MKNAAFAKETRKWAGKYGAAALDRARKGLPIDDEDEALLHDVVMNSYGGCAERTLTLGWDCNRPGGMLENEGLEKAALGAQNRQTRRVVGVKSPSRH
jgi:hypothetical protein